MALKFEFFERPDVGSLLDRIRAKRWKEIDPSELHRTLEVLSVSIERNLEPTDEIVDDPTRDFMYGHEAKAALNAICAALTRRVGRPRKIGSLTGWIIEGNNSRAVTTTEMLRRELLLKPAIAIREARRSGGNECAILAASLRKESPSLTELQARRRATELLSNLKQWSRAKITARTTDRKLTRICKLRSVDLPKPRGRRVIPIAK